MKIKRLLALLLSLCMMASLAVTAAAVEEEADPPQASMVAELPAPAEAVELDPEEPEPMLPAVPEAAVTQASGTCDCGKVVQVFVKGFLHPLYYDYKGDQTDQAFVLLHFLMNDQGESVKDISKRWKPVDVSNHKDGLPVEVGNHEDGPEYEFLYDYRMDPFTNAKQLGEFIDYLIETTGHEKVALTGMSQGTSVVTTYLMTEPDVYDKLETLILVSGSYQGVTVIGELLTRRLSLSMTSILNLVATMNDSPLFKAFINLLRVVFAPFKTSPAGNMIFGSKLYSWIVMKLAGQMPAIWTFIPGDPKDPEGYYAQARKLLTGNEKYKKLLDWADEYNYDIRPNVPAKLQEAKAAGVKVAIIAHYGKAAIPLLTTYDKQTDILIDTEYGSCGATVARIGKILTPEQIKNPAYLSCDGIIDSSTCVLPDQTWFIKYIGHDFMPSEALRMKIIHEKEFYPSIKSYADFPQYLRLTADKLHTIPLDEEPISAPTTIAEALAGLAAAF